ncbi:MAG: SDR family oxidoreductase [Candidatus Omnitrophica bacterium]|nr:SDR family oxidoreductase [Candidatus Omnitrophota bacterium]
MKCLVVGGSRGIGRSLVSLLRERAHDVWFTYNRSVDAARALSKETGAAHLAYDQNSDASVEDLKRTVLTEKFDSLVYLAAEPFERKSLIKTPADEYLTYITRGVRGAYSLSTAFAESNRTDKRPASLVHVLSSVVLGAPPERQGPYVGLKYLLWGMSRSMAAEFGKYNIRVNTVSPGMTRTDFISDLPERFIETLETSLPMGRLLKPEEVAAAIRFLICNHSSALRDVNLPVTGGA